MSASVLYHDLVAVMSRHLSLASIEATLGTVLAKKGLSASDLDPETLPGVVGEAMLGLRTFCSPDRLPELMLELADFIDRETSEPLDADSTL